MGARPILRVVPVRQLRLVVTATDYDEAVHFYRDVLGLGERDAVQSPDGLQPTLFQVD